MVLKTIHLTAVEAAKTITAWIILSSFIWTVGAFIFVNVWAANREQIVLEAGLATREDIKELKVAVSDAAASFQELSRQIVVLSQPDNVVNYRDLPTQVNSCYPGTECAIVIFAERDPRAVACRLIPQRTELLIIIENREYVAVASPNRPGTNLSTSPRALEPVFNIPRGIPIGTARALIRTHYDSCPWQLNGQPPVEQDSPTFSMLISSAR